MPARLGELGSNEVHCWHFNSSDFTAEELASVLSEDERDRARRFAFERDRMEYVVCRGLLRNLLAAYGLGSASSLTFSYTVRGKPMLTVDCDLPIAFSVAHSRGAGLIGLGYGISIGVDVEIVRPVDNFCSLAATCLAPEEQAELAALPAGLQTRAFYAGWTRKEALIKATGEGLSRPLHSFAVTIGPGVPPRLIRFDGDPDPARTWQIVDLTYDPQFAAAVAVSNVQAIVHAGHLLRGRFGFCRVQPDGC
jgi:4'-phosphopantetheinyl transferase